MSDEKHQDQTRYFIIFREIERLKRTEGAYNDADYQESEEIDRLRKIVLEVSEDRPKFSTST